MMERAKWVPHHCLAVDSCTDYAFIDSYNGLGKKRPLGSSSSNPLPWTGSLDQVAQRPILLGFGEFQGLGMHNFSGQPVPLLTTITVFLPNIQSTLSFKGITLCPITAWHCKKSFSSPLITPFRCWKVLQLLVCGCLN